MARSRVGRHFGYHSALGLGLRCNFRVHQLGVFIGIALVFYFIYTIPAVYMLGDMLMVYIYVPVVSVI